MMACGIILISFCVRYVMVDRPSGPTAVEYEYDTVRYCMVDPFCRLLTSCDIIVDVVPCSAHIGISAGWQPMFLFRCVLIREVMTFDSKNEL